MSNILDWTSAALKKKADLAALDGNVVLAKLLDNCLEMYEDGLILLTWESGEPYLILTERGVAEIDTVNAMMGSNFSADDYIIETEADIAFEEWEDE